VVLPGVVLKTQQAKPTDAVRFCRTTAPSPTVEMSMEARIMHDPTEDLSGLAVGPDAVPELEPEGNGRRLTIPLDLIYGESVSPFERLGNGTIAVTVPTVRPQPIIAPDLTHNLVQVRVQAQSCRPAYRRIGRHLPGLRKRNGNFVLAPAPGAVSCGLISVEISLGDRVFPQRASRVPRSAGQRRGRRCACAHSAPGTRSRR
jgi:hypothetical protein